MVKLFLKFFENGDKNDIECGYGRTGNSAEYRKRGTHVRSGLDYWHLLDITYYENLEEFFRKNPDNGNFYYFTTKATHRHTDVKYPDNVYLFFGKETKGLPENLLHDNPQTSVRIPMLNNPDARSLNLSNSVAIGVYEVLRQWNYPKLLCEGKLRDYEWDV